MINNMEGKTYRRYDERSHCLKLWLPKIEGTDRILSRFLRCVINQSINHF